MRAVAVVLAFAAAACAPEPPPDGPRVLPRDTGAPYVVTAIDYHFHDSHPTPRLAEHRELVMSNQGRNVHNVTFLDGSYSRDLQPGERISLGRVGDLLPEPGRHRFVCTYHEDRGMTGVIVVAD